MINNINNNIINTSEPSYLNYGYNPIYVKFKSYEFPSVSPIAPYINIEINVNPVENDYIVINNIKYIFKANPTYGQIAIGANVFETAEDLYHVLNDDPRINYGYTIGHATNSKYVFVKSKLVGTNYNITFTSSTIGIFLTINQESANYNRAQSLNNYSMYLDIFKDDNFYFGQNITAIYNPTYLTTIERDYQNNNEYVFDLSSIINKYLETSLPDLSRTDFYKVDGWMTDFSFKFGEAYSSSFENKYKRKFEIGQGFNYFISNTSKNIYENESINQYVSSATNAEVEITFNVTYGSGTTITFKNTTFNLIGAVTYAGLLTSVADFVNDFNASIHATDYIASSISNIVYIIAKQSGSLYNFNVYTNTSVITIRDTSTTFTTQNVTTVNGVDGSAINLTYQPTIKTINKDSNEMLYFIWKQTNVVIPKFVLLYEIVYYDNSGTSFFEAVTTSSLGGCYAVNINPFNAINPNETPIEFIKHIIVTVKYSYTNDLSSTNTLTQPQTYLVNEDIEYRNENKTNFIFQNKLGVFDSVSFNGVTTYSINRLFKSYKIANTIDNDETTGLSRTLVANTNDIELYNSGWIDYNHFIWLKELLNSLRVYKLIGDNRYQIINITDSTYEYNDKTDLYNLSITTTKTYTENNISN